MYLIGPVHTRGADCFHQSGSSTPHRKKSCHSPWEFPSSWLLAGCKLPWSVILEAVIERAKLPDFSVAHDVQADFLLLADDLMRGVAPAANVSLSWGRSCRIARTVSATSDGPGAYLHAL